MFSYQLYSSRNFPPVSDTMKMLAAAGYGAVEGFGGLYGDDAAVDAMEAGLRSTGLTMPTAHFGLDMIEASPEKVIAVAKRLGIRRIYCPWIHPDQRPADGAGWRALGARLQKAGAPIREADLGFGWHNHDFEFKPCADGSIPQAEMFKGGPDLEWEMDVAWVVRGGADPFAWIEAEKSRITAAHVKDIAPAGQNADQDGWSDVGAGTVPWARLLPALRAIGVQHFVMEHDNPKDDAGFAAASIAAVKGYSRMDKLGIGIIGCGNISAAYLRLAPSFKGLEVRAVADMNMANAEARATEFNTKAQSVEDLLANKDIDVVINLTIPDAHFAVTKSILEAGKHAYSEKPLVLTLEQGETLRALAASKGLAVGCAPDTFLGGAHQQARAVLDEGRIGTITAGCAAVLNHGMEHWHPNPDFFFLPGAGPMLDLGPYYVANLINLLGPVKRVGALTSSETSERTIANGPRNGEKVPVKTPTNIHALLEFHNGATINLSTSWDVWHHKRNHFELYGTEGTLYVPDPNFFGGQVEVGGRDGSLTVLPAWDHPFGKVNQHHNGRDLANYRTAGLADMVAALRDGRDARCSLDRTLHGVEVMTACIKSGERGEFLTMTTTCTRPAALGIAEAQALLA